VDGFIFSGEGGLTATNAPPPALQRQPGKQSRGIVQGRTMKKTASGVTVARRRPLGARELRAFTATGVSDR